MVLATSVPLMSRLTLATPTLSVALAATETTPFTVLLGPGELIATEGAWVSVGNRWRR